MSAGGGGIVLGQGDREDYSDSESLTDSDDGAVVTGPTPVPAPDDLPPVPEPTPGEAPPAETDDEDDDLQSLSNSDDEDDDLQSLSNSDEEGPTDTEALAAQRKAKEEQAAFDAEQLKKQVELQKEQAAAWKKVKNEMLIRKYREEMLAAKKDAGDQDVADLVAVDFGPSTPPEEVELAKAKIWDAVQRAKQEERENYELRFRNSPPLLDLFLRWLDSLTKGEEDLEGLFEEVTPETQADFLDRVKREIASKTTDTQRRKEEEQQKQALLAKRAADEAAEDAALEAAMIKTLEEAAAREAEAQQLKDAAQQEALRETARAEALVAFKEQKVREKKEDQCRRSADRAAQQLRSDVEEILTRQRREQRALKKAQKEEAEKNPDVVKKSDFKTVTKESVDEKKFKKLVNLDNKYARQTVKILAVRREHSLMNRGVYKNVPDSQFPGTFGAYYQQAYPGLGRAEARAKGSNYRLDYPVSEYYHPDFDDARASLDVMRIAYAVEPQQQTIAGDGYDALGFDGNGFFKKDELFPTLSKQAKETPCPREAGQKGAAKAPPANIWDFTSPESGGGVLGFAGADKLSCYLGRRDGELYPVHSNSETLADVGHRLLDKIFEIQTRRAVPKLVQQAGSATIANWKKTLGYQANFFPASHDSQGGPDDKFAWRGERFSRDQLRVVWFASVDPKGMDPVDLPHLPDDLNDCDLYDRLTGVGGMYERAGIKLDEAEFRDGVKITRERNYLKYRGQIMTYQRLIMFERGESQRQVECPKDMEVVEDAEGNLVQYADEDDAGVGVAERPNANFWARDVVGLDARGGVGASTTRQLFTKLQKEASEARSQRRATFDAELARAANPLELSADETAEVVKQRRDYDARVPLELPTLKDVQAIPGLRQLWQRIGSNKPPSESQTGAAGTERPPLEDYDDKGNAIPEGQPGIRFAQRWEHWGVWRLKTNGDPLPDDVEANGMRPKRRDGKTGPYEVGGKFKASMRSKLGSAYILQWAILPTDEALELRLAEKIRDRQLKPFLRMSFLRNFGYNPFELAMKLLGADPLETGFPQNRDTTRSRYWRASLAYYRQSQTENLTVRKQKEEAKRQEEAAKLLTSLGGEEAVPALVRVISDIKNLGLTVEQRQEQLQKLLKGEGLPKKTEDVDEAKDFVNQQVDELQALQNASTDEEAKRAFAKLDAAQRRVKVRVDWITKVVDKDVQDLQDAKLIEERDQLAQFLEAKRNQLRGELRTQFGTESPETILPALQEKMGEVRELIQERLRAAKKVYEQVEIDLDAKIKAVQVAKREALQAIGANDAQSQMLNMPNILQRQVPFGEGIYAHRPRFNKSATANPWPPPLPPSRNPDRLFQIELGLWETDDEYADRVEEWIKTAADNRQPWFPRRHEPDLTTCWPKFTEAVTRLATGSAAEQALGTALIIRFPDAVALAFVTNGARPAYTDWEKKKYQNKERVRAAFDKMMQDWKKTPEGRSWNTLSRDAKTRARERFNDPQQEWFTVQEWKVFLANPANRTQGGIGAPLVPPLVQLYMDADDTMRSMMQHAHGTPLLAQLCVRLGQLGEHEVVKKMGFEWVLQE